MRANKKTIILAKIRYYIREATKWHKVGNGMPHFYTSENYQKSRRVKEPALGKHPYYAKSDKAIEEIAKKIYNLVKDE